MEQRVQRMLQRSSKDRSPSKDKERLAAESMRSVPTSRSVSPDKRVSPEIRPSELKKEDLIGSGSFGAVWRGRWRNQEVAIKICKVTSSSDAKMLKGEISYLCRLRNHRLVSFLGFAHQHDCAIIVMEFMPGGSLSQLLFSECAAQCSKRNALTFDRRSAMGAQIAEGLSYLHEVKVIHRDLKTMNVVLDDGLNCKICDFGLTVSLERTHVTVLGVQGSPRYMAPEQLEADSAKVARINEKVDIWQMGCVLLELLCKVVPFASQSSMAGIISELLVKRRAPAIPAEADPRARVLIAACLRLKPGLRPSAEMLLEALQGINTW